MWFSLLLLGAAWRRCAMVYLLYTKECTVWLGDNIGRREGQMYTDMCFEGSALGSPVFDSSGRIVAMALIDGSGYVTPIEEIVESFRALT